MKSTNQPTAQPSNHSTNQLLNHLPACPPAHPPLHLSMDLTSSVEKHAIHTFCEKCLSRLKDGDRRLPQVCVCVCVCVCVWLVCVHACVSACPGSRMGTAGCIRCVFREGYKWWGES